MRRVVAIRFSSLGDIVLTLPALAYLREAAGPTHITFVTKAGWAELLCRCAIIDEVVDLPDGAPRNGLASRLRLGAPNVVLDFHNNIRSHALTALLVGVPVFRTPGTRVARLRLLLARGRGPRTGARRRLPAVVVQHRAVVDRYLLRVPPPAGGGLLEASPPRPAFRPAEQRARKRTLFEAPARGRRWVAEQVPRGAPVVALAPGAHHANKRWPATRYRALAARLGAAGIVPLVLGGPQEAALLSFVAEGARCAVVVPPRWDLVLAALERATTAVANDSGLAHLAETICLPVVSLFGPTVPEFGFAPTDPRSIVCQHPLPCRPCSLHGGPSCAQGRHACLATITADEVLELVRERLGA